MSQKGPLIKRVAGGAAYRGVSISVKRCKHAHIFINEKYANSLTNILRFLKKMY